MVINYLKRAYTVVELRTGFVAFSSALIGIGFGYYISGNFNTLASISLLISAFFMNLVANVSAEIKGFILEDEGQDYLTGHSGSEGLSRGDASLQDAYLALFICLCIAGISGLLAVLISSKIVLVAIGISGLLAALLYSLTPLAYNKYPVSETVSGLMCGYLCTISGIIIQTDLSIEGHLLGMMTFIMVWFLMAANNTVDYQKDMGKRVTLAHLLGFKKSIRILSLGLILLFGLWVLISARLHVQLSMFMFGLGLLVYYGLFKWYFKYYKVELKTENLGRIFGPLPLTLLLNFNIYMFVAFVIAR